MRDDISGGLKNALERGSTLEQAIRSFISAGYPESEVREASLALDTSALALAQSPQSQMPSEKPLPQIIPKLRMQPPRQPIFNPPSAQALAQQQEPSASHTPNWLIIILSIILFLSLCALIVSLLFKDEIATFVSSLF